MADPNNPFKPGLAAALSKLDPEDSEQIMDYFKTHVLMIREKALLQASVREEKKLLVENAKLKQDIAQLKLQLQEKQRRRTAKVLHSPAPPPPPSPASSLPVNHPPSSSSSSSLDQSERQSRRRRGERRARPRCDSLGAEPRVDVSRLDVRIGRILSARRHPLAEALCVQEVDVGEPAPRTVVSKLGERTELEE
uniref:aminoacyl tRNA synthase complex-interacting multifunctional protein 1-like n=1 Tax=Centroberyx gerrardi TaxID=166262 RepID=UPI003AAD8331